MMYFLPYDDFEIRTQKPPELICGILSEQTTEPTIGFRIHPGSNPFYGKVNDMDFKIYPHINYRNSFLPVIKGAVTTQGNLSIVKIRMRMHIIVRIFDVFWFGGVGIGFITALLSTFFSADKAQFLYADLIMAAMLLFGYVLELAGFSYEAQKAKKLLFSLLQEPDNFTHKDQNPT